MTTTAPSAAPRPLLGIGSCLAGNAVRYNGADNPPNEYVRAICEHFATQAFCPEVAIGLGVPRPPIHLVGSAQVVRVLDVHTHRHDYTQPLQAYAQDVLRQAPGLCGYILVKGSPSCGYGQVKRYATDGDYLAADQQGIFASALAAADPLLPLDDDEGLRDPGRRESFVIRAYAYHEWKLLLAQGLTAHHLIEFYSRYKYLVMAHDVSAYQTLGPMLANAGSRDLNTLAGAFVHTLMTALSQRATRRSHSNVLFHLAGYLRKHSSAQRRQQLHKLIEDYRTGKVALRVPLTQLQRDFGEIDDAYIHRQVYLDPYPQALQERDAD